MIKIEWGVIASLVFWLAVPMVGWLLSRESSFVGALMMVMGGITLALVVIPIIAEGLQKF